MNAMRKKRMIYLLAAVVLLPVLLFVFLSLTATRPTNLGVVDGRLAPCPSSPNCVSTQATDEQHQIAPIPFDGATADAIRRLKAAIATVPRMTVITEKETYLYAEATSLLFRFVDDVEFYVDSNARVIHFRSASRAGRGDLGVNRARMEKIRTAFEKTE
jgi:uncharacterized protein (DUF1499 family)